MHTTRPPDTSNTNKNSAYALDISVNLCLINNKAFNNAIAIVSNTIPENVRNMPANNNPAKAPTDIKSRFIPMFSYILQSV